jgi:hypothetical protein
MSDDNGPVDLIGNTDARAWAREFTRRVEDDPRVSDEGVMIGWFAAAIMAGVDSERNKRDKHLALGQPEEQSPQPGEPQFTRTEDGLIGVTWPDPKPASIQMDTGMFEEVVEDMNLLRQIIDKQAQIIGNWRLGHAPNKADYQAVADLVAALGRNIPWKHVTGP